MDRATPQPASNLAASNPYFLAVPEQTHSRLKCSAHHTISFLVIVIQGNSQNTSESHHLHQRTKPKRCWLLYISNGHCLLHLLLLK